MLVVYSDLIKGPTGKPVRIGLAKRLAIPEHSRASDVDTYDVGDSLKEPLTIRPVGRKAPPPARAAKPANEMNPELPAAQQGAATERVMTQLVDAVTTIADRLQKMEGQRKGLKL